MRARLVLVSIAIWGTTAGSPLVAQQDEGDNTGTSPTNFHVRHPVALRQLVPVDGDW